MSLFAALLCGCLDRMVSDRSLRGAARHLRKDGWQKSTLLLVVLMVAGVGAASPAQADSAPEDSEWHEFSGTWTAAGADRSLISVAIAGPRLRITADH
jgi:hypothetical protein